MSIFYSGIFIHFLLSWTPVTLSTITTGSTQTDLLHIGISSKRSTAFLKAIFWEVKPFIFKTKTGKFDGIIPRIFENGDKYCSSVLFNINASKDHISLIEFTLQTRDRAEFLDILNDFVYENDTIRNIQLREAVLFPVVTMETPPAVAKHFKRFQLLQLSGMAVIVPRYRISLPYKILRGILSCQQIFIIAFLLGAVFGIVVWFFERVHNKEFPASFIKGICHALWWSIVSMTTVGYGDIVPKSFAGRFVALFWLLIGVLMGCLMTATMTDVVSGVSDLSIYNRRVAVLEKSFEEKVVGEDYQAIPVPAKSYFEVLDLVRNGEVFAAMIAADVAAWYHKELNEDNSSTPLSIVHVLPANLFVNSYFTNEVSFPVSKIFECMYHMRDEVYTQPFKLFQKFCHTETLYIGSSLDLFKESLLIKGLLAVLGILLTVGVCFEISQHLFYNGNQTQQRKLLAQT